MTGPTTNEELLAKLDAEENPVTRGVLKDICVRRLRESVEIQRELEAEVERLRNGLEFYAQRTALSRDGGQLARKYLAAIEGDGWRPLLAAILKGRHEPLDPHHAGAIRDRLGNPSDDELEDIILGRTTTQTTDAEGKS
jgi:hypothetical protein